MEKTLANQDVGNDAELELHYGPLLEARRVLAFCGSCVNSTEHHKKAGEFIFRCTRCGEEYVPPGCKKPEGNRKVSA